MSEIDGRIISNQPYVSTKTPLGNKIQQKIEKGARIDCTISISKVDDKKVSINERVELEVSGVNDRHIQLDYLPDYLQTTVPKSVDRVTFYIHRVITSHGSVVMEFDETDPPTDTTGITPQDVPAESGYEGPASREILESITADVLQTLGYDTNTNVYRSNRETSTTTEVDIWAENPQQNFSIYVSCKNWDSKVGRQTVDEEVGRIMNLQKVPQLRVLVVGDLTEDAEKALESNGFLAITLGEQANEKNADEIYAEVRLQFTEALLAIAPTSVEQIAQKADELAQELSGLSDDIRRIDID